MKSKIVSGIVGISIALGATTINVVPVDGDCFQSMQTPLYDTPSGFLDEDHYDPLLYNEGLNISKLISAKRIGEQAVTMCDDGSGKITQLPISLQEYKDLEHGGKPKKTVFKPLISL